MSVHEFQDIIGVKFNDVDLLKQALTHRSFINEQTDAALEDNERLEFLGDAILDFVAADMLYRRFPEMNEGELTRLRSALVRTELLAALALDCNIGAYIYMGKGEENSGGRTRTNNLCRAFEAVIGAVYLDQGLQVITSFLVPRLTRLQSEVIDEALHKDARSRLQEWSQAHLSITPSYQMVSSSGPDHSKEFLIAVVLGDKVVASGTGRSKQLASQAAAQAALDLVGDGSITTE